MWTRSELKSKAKVAFKANYWKSVLVAILLSILLGVGMGTARGQFRYGGQEAEPVGIEQVGIEETAVPEPEPMSSEDARALLIVTPLLLLIVLAVVVVVFLIEAAVANPLEVGARRFFVHNLHQPAQMREVLYAFDHGYRPVLKTMIIRDLRLIGWALLFVIPGIVKSYEYRMIPYLLAERPDLPTDEAFAESRRLMMGNKWNAFVLDLSFLGWGLLSAITLGLAGVLYANPYKAQTDAALYEALRYGDGMPNLTELPEA